MRTEAEFQRVCKDRDEWRERAEEMVERLDEVHERVVRCRDCRWFGEDTSDHEYRSGWWCSRLDFDTVEDGFCHLGDPREED